MLEVLYTLASYIDLQAFISGVECLFISQGLGTHMFFNLEKLVEINKVFS